MATTGDDGTVYLWNTEGTYLYSLPCKAQASLTQFDVNGHYLVTVCEDYKAYLWKVADGSLHHGLPHQVMIECVSFCHDGKYVATGAKNGNADIWEVDTGHRIASLAHTDRGVTALAFSPDGKYLATGCNDGMVRIWLWQATDLVHEAMARVAHAITEEEWRQYADDEPYQVISSLFSI